MRFTHVASHKSAELAYLAGDLDATDIAESSIPEFKEDIPASSKLVTAQTTGFTWMGMNVDHEPFGDIRVRRAIQAAIDAEEINDGAYFGAAAVGTGIIAPGLEGYWDVERPKPDLVRARQLLAEAGFPNGFDTHITVLKLRRTGGSLPDHPGTTCTDRSQRRSAQVRRRDLLEPGARGEGR